MINNVEILEAIKIALPIFAEHRHSEWENLVNALDKTVVSTPIVGGLLEFMPLAFGRVFLNGMGIEFSDVYVRYNSESGRKRELKLTNNLFYKQSFEAATLIIAKNMAGEAFTAVALRSPELMAVNDLLNKGSKPEDLVLSPPYLQWNENDQPPTTLETKDKESWGRFWK